MIWTHWNKRASKGTWVLNSTGVTLLKQEPISLIKQGLICLSAAASTSLLSLVSYPSAERQMWRWEMMRGGGHLLLFLCPSPASDPADISPDFWEFSLFWWGMDNPVGTAWCLIYRVLRLAGAINEMSPADIMNAASRGLRELSLSRGLK